MSLSLPAAFAIAVCACSAFGQSFVDSSQAELLQKAPELAGLEFSPNQSTLDPLLRETGQQLESMLARFMNVSIGENVHEMRFDSATLMWKERRDEFRYLVRTRPFVESRSALGNGPQSDGSGRFLISGDLIGLLGDLLPGNQQQARFRYLGQIQEDGRKALVIAFTEKDGEREGLAWLDEPSKRILRIRCDFLKAPAGQSFNSFSQDIRFVAVSFSPTEPALWLPARASEDVRFAGGEFHTVHRFSDYRLEEFASSVGQSRESVSMLDDGIEVLMKGLASLAGDKPSEALAPLREASGRLAKRPEPKYYLGLALYQTGDLDAAAAQFRATLKLAPDFAPAHNDLGSVLLARGDKAAAVVELKEALRLAPNDAKIRANLDAATEQPAAETEAGAGEPLLMPAQQSDTTIKVNVRQVLVPVVVTDKDGHHVTGLTQANFKILEDGVEQKITAFSSERADVAVSPTSQTVQAAQASAGPPKLLPKQHAFVICLDLMHGEFANSVRVREALRKLFQQEQAGDSQYVLIALGRKMEIIQNTTSDPAQVLEKLSDANFHNAFKLSQKSAWQSEIPIFEGDLQEARAACDAGDTTCFSKKRVLPAQARKLAEQERIDTLQFLAELRSVVEQTARGNGRRTLILISDGFSLTLGQTSFTLLEAYFPEYSNERSPESLQDAVQPIFKTAVKANVPIYTIDSRGLYAPPAYDASRGANLSVATQVARALDNIALDSGQTLSEIAGETGGTFFQNSNDLFAGLKRAFADGREYYMLAYVSSNAALDGKFRKIEVKVQEKNAVVNAKRGYWATPQ